MRPIKVSDYLISNAEYEARKSNVIRSKMSALVLSSSRRGILSMSHNVRIMDGKRWTLHAEERLIAKYRDCFDTILVYRANGCGTSKPCPRCLKLLNDAGVNKVIFFDNQWLIASVRELLTLVQKSSTMVAVKNG